MELPLGFLPAQHIFVSVTAAGFAPTSFFSGEVHPPEMILIPSWYCRYGRALTSVEIILRYSMLGVRMD